MKTFCVPVGFEVAFKIPAGSRTELEICRTFELGLVLAQNEGNWAPSAGVILIGRLRVAWLITVGDTWGMPSILFVVCPCMTRSVSFSRRSASILVMM